MKGTYQYAWLMGLLLAVFSVHAQSTVDSIRFWTAPDNTRLVFDVSAPPSYRVFMLENPKRVVIDIAKASLKGGIPRPPADHPLFSGIRSGVRDNYDLRFVVDLKTAVRPKSFSLKPNETYGHRLVVDLYGQPLPAARPTARAPAEPIAVAPSKTVSTRPPPSTPPAASAKTSPAGVATAASATQDRPAAVKARPEKPKVTARAAAPPTSRDLIIAIDAGHGGEDPGAIGKLGTREKDVVLRIARKLEALVQKQPGMRPVMVRTGDYYVGLRKRMEIARKAKADLFVSIHADAFNDTKVRGSSVFTLSRTGASSEAARLLADRENAADLIGGISLDDKDNLLASVLLDLSQTATLEASQELAENILARIRRVGKLHHARVQNAGFAVLKAPDIPSILVETAFISNPDEERNLRTGRHQQNIARAVFDGIVDYFSVRSPGGTRLAGATRHVISKGETLSGIAALYGVTMKSLQNHNALKTSEVKVGQVLEIPADG